MAEATIPAGAEAAVDTRAPVASPGAIVWQRLSRNGPAIWSLRFLLFLYAVAWFAPFLAPYGESSGERTRPFQPPSSVTWSGGPAVRTVERVEGKWQPAGTPPRPLALFVRGDSYAVLPGIRWDRHLFGLAPGANGATDRVYLLGADQFGRDLFSRLLYAARVSLSVGIIGVMLSFLLGLLIGGWAGYRGGWTDALLMRGSEILMSIPALYLILALRTAFPATLPSAWTYLMIIVILSLVTWTGLGRIVRGMVLSLKTRDYVTAAEALGLPPGRILVRHLLPNTLSFAIVAATIAVPGYILGEVALSFLGVGIQEPSASWGNLLQQAASVSTMEEAPWILWPGAAIFVTVLAFNVLGDGLRDALDPRHLDA